MLNRILVPLDRSSFADQAISPAFALARASGANLDFVLVHRPYRKIRGDNVPWDPDQLNADTVDADRRYLDAIVAEIGVSGTEVRATSDVLIGEPAPMIAHRARDTGADLIVMTSHGRTGFSRAWLGSVADSVIRQSSVPVLMLRPTPLDAALHPGDRSFDRILVSLDGSDESAAVLPAAVAIAKASGGQLTLLRVVVPVPTAFTDATVVTPMLYPDERTTELLVAAATSDLRRVADSLALEGVTGVGTRVVIAPSVAPAILDAARSYDANLIAMATHGRGSSRLLVGSVADKVLRGASAAMLLQRSSVPIDEVETEEEEDVVPILAIP